MCLVQQRKVVRYLMTSSVTPWFLGDSELGKSGHGQHSIPTDKSTYFLVQECKKSLTIKLAPSEGGSFGVYVRLGVSIVRMWLNPNRTRTAAGFQVSVTVRTDLLLASLWCFRPLSQTWESEGNIHSNYHCYIGATSA